MLPMNSISQQALRNNSPFRLLLSFEKCFFLSRSRITNVQRQESTLYVSITFSHKTNELYTIQAFIFAATT